jgi:hypothetical protein
MTRRILAAMGAGVVFLVLVAVPIVGQQQSGLADSEAAEIRKLQQERVLTLTQLVKLLTAQHEAAKVDITKLADAQIELLKAQLELAETPKARIELLEAQLKIQQKVVVVWEERLRAGNPESPAEVWRAKLPCIDVKIRLIRERAKLKSP